MFDCCTCVWWMVEQAELEPECLCSSWQQSTSGCGCWPAYITARVQVVHMRLSLAQCPCSQPSDRVLYAAHNSLQHASTMATALYSSSAVDAM